MPGRCPACNQAYDDDSLSFCPNDGSPLTKETAPAYDPQTLIAPPPPTYQPQQQGYYPPPGGQAPPQGEQAPPQGWQQPPYGQQQQPPYGQEQPPPYGQQPPPYGQQQQPPYGQEQPPPYGQQQQSPYGQQQYAPQYGAGGAKTKLPIIIAIAAVVLIGGGIGLYFMLRDNSSTSPRVVNVNPSSNTSRTTSTIPTMPTPGTTYPTPSTTTTTTTGGYYSEDDKHKLFQAVGRTGDNALIVEVAEKLGLSNAAGQPTPTLQPFIKEHLNWALRNTAWVQEYSDPVKARQYVMANK